MNKEITIQELVRLHPNKNSYLQSLFSESSFWQANFIDDSAWIEHIPFAFWITDILRPRTFVELGTHHGVSYFSFCQAIQQLKIPTKAYAVDHWKGDLQSGFYGEEIFKKVSEQNNKYTSFSSLIRSNFDDALSYFEDESIDLLHIDGYHTYEVVKHDFESWLPKLTANAVVLFHDTNIKERNFGVFRLWTELVKIYNGFEFFHGCGLGVLAIGNEYPDAIRFLLKNSTDTDGLLIRNYFSRLGLLFKYESENKDFIRQLKDIQVAVSEKDKEIDILNKKLKQENIRFVELNEQFQLLTKETEELKQQVNKLSESNRAFLEKLMINQKELVDFEITKQELIRKEKELSGKDEQYQHLINNEIPQLRKELITLSELNERLKQEMQEKEKENWLKREAFIEEMSRIKQQLAESESHFQISTELLKKETDLLNNQLNESTRNSELLQDLINKQKLEYESLEKDLTQKSISIKHFEQSIQRLFNWITLELNRPETKDESLLMLAEHLKELPDSSAFAFEKTYNFIYELISTNKKLKDDSASLKEKIKELDKQIRGLELSNNHIQSEKNRLADQLGEIKSGVSWRITAPLRFARKIFPGMARIVGIPIRSNKKIEFSHDQMAIETKTTAIEDIPILKQAELINMCRIFNAEWYTGQYPDVSNFKEGSLHHFLLHGAFENRNPHPLFDTRWYRNYYKLDNSINPLIHFLENSNNLNYNPNAFLNLDWYNQIYLKKSFIKSYEVLLDYYENGEKKYFQPSNNFNPFFYARQYPEASEYTFGLLAHYLRIGRVKKFIPFESGSNPLHPLSIELHQLNIDDIKLNEVLSQLFGSTEQIKDFFEFCKCLPEDIPLRFHPDNYVSYNWDLQNLKGNTFEIFKHFCAHGIRENRVYLDLDINECTQRFYDIWNINRQSILYFKPKTKVCVLVHIYYMDLYEELRSYLQNLSVVNHQLYFSLVENNWTLDIHRKIKSDFPEARVVISKNIGRDIGGFFNLLSYISNIREYDTFLLVHSKKSPHISEGLSTKWRRDLLNATIGSKEITLQNLYLIDKHINIGIIGSELWRHKSVDGNREKYSRILDLLEIDEINRHCDYLSGTMLWLNSKILDYLYTKCSSLAFEDGNNKTLEFHKDGQWAHAVERVLGNICQQMSLKMVLR